MGCFAPDAPPPRDYGAETRDTLQAQIDLAPQLYASEAEYQPQYVDLALSNLNRMLQGAGGEPGLIDTLRAQSTAQRAADIGDVETLGGRATEAMLASNPAQRQLLELLNAQAVQGLQAGTTMTPEEARQVQQASRAAFAARGMGGTNAAIGDELLQQYNLGQQLLRQRQDFGGRVLGYNQAIVGDPFLQILGRPSSAMNNAQGLFAESGPSLFNPESAYAGNIANANQQMQALFADPSTMSKVGAVANTAGSFIGSIASSMI